MSPLSLCRRRQRLRFGSLAQHLGLPSWDKPALACLSSRFPYGQEITPGETDPGGAGRRIPALSGLPSGTRVRHHGEIARLEVGPEEMERAFAEREEISTELKDAGFLYVALDLVTGTSPAA